MEKTGTVIEALPNQLFKVRFDDKEELICHVSGKMRINTIKILVGDRVLVVIDPYYGRATHRIVRRM